MREPIASQYFTVDVTHTHTRQRGPTFHILWLLGDEHQRKKWGERRRRNNPRVKRDHRSEPQLENAEGYTISDQMRRERETTWTHVHTHVGQLYTHKHIGLHHIYICTHARCNLLCVNIQASLSTWWCTHESSWRRTDPEQRAAISVRPDRTRFSLCCVFIWFSPPTTPTQSLNCPNYFGEGKNGRRDIICW